MGIKRKHKVLNTWIRELRGVTTEVDKRYDQGIDKSGKIPKRFNVRELLIVTWWVGHRRGKLIL